MLFVFVCSISVADSVYMYTNRYQSTTISIFLSNIEEVEEI